MSTSRESASRRGVLAALGLTGAATAALSILPRQAGDAAATAQTAPRKPPEKGGGYALTEHVKRYFKTTLI